MHFLIKFIVVHALLLLQHWCNR